jgi:hypothetical protein
MKVEEKFNIEGIAEQIYQEMKEDGEGFEEIDYYWNRVEMNLHSRGYKESEVKILGGLVMDKVEELFGKEE